MFLAASRCILQVLSPVESANVKHNIALTSDGMRWNEYMDHEATMVEEHAGDGSRMCISPTNLMGDLRRDDGSLGQVTAEREKPCQRARKAVRTRQ